MKNINKIFNPLKNNLSYGESHQGSIVVLKY
jgi:hypothetical protein